MKKIILITFFSSLFLFSCWKEENIPKKHYQTSIVQSGNIDTTNSFVWYTDSFIHTPLAPKVGGKIVSIHKNVWDRVKPGELIAILDGTEGKTWYASSNDIIYNLEILKSSTSQMFESQIMMMEEKISQARIGVDIAHISSTGNASGVLDTKNITQSQLDTLDKQIQTAQTQIETSSLQFENTRNTLLQQESDIYTNSKSALSNSIILWNNITLFLDNLFWITDTNKHKNNSFEIYLGAKNSSLKTQAENEIRSLLKNFSELKSLSGESKDEIKMQLESYHQFFSQDMRQVLKNTFWVLENSVEASSFPQSMIDEYKKHITEFQTQNEQIILSVSGNFLLGLKGSLDNINNFEVQKKSTLDMLEKQLELAKQQKETLMQSKNQIFSTWNAQMNDITTRNEIAKKQKELSQNNLQEALAWLEALKKQKQASLSQIDTQIAEVKAGKNEAAVMIENGKVTSLIEWVVTQKMAEVGSVIGAGMPIVMIANDRKIKIEVWVWDDMIEKINIWDTIEVEIEWISEMRIGNISKIFPTKDMITKKTLVEITLDNEKNNIKIWSYSKVYFDTQSEDNNIIIPNNAIISKFMIPGVYILEDNTAKFKNIEIIKIWEKYSQISGLKVWEIIITQGKENIYDGEFLTK